MAMSTVLLLALAAASRAEMRRIALSTNDLIADPVRGRIYASVGGTVGPIGNHVVTIFPDAARFEASPLGAFVGSEPTRLALDDAASVLYVALAGAPFVARIDLSSFTRDAYFSLGFEPFSGARYAGDIAVAPGQPDVIAIALRNQGQSVIGVGVWDHGVKRPTSTASFTDPQWIEFSSDPTLLYGLGGYNGFQHLAVGPSGVTVLSDPPPQFGGSYADFRFDGEIIVTTDGHALDPATGGVLGTYSVESSPGFIQPVHGPVVSDPSNDRVYYATDSFGGVGPRWTLRTYSRSLFVLLETRGIPGVSGQVRSLVRWGADGVALGTDDGHVYLIAPSFGPCSDAAQCDDVDACTIDSCDANTCVHRPLDCGSDPCSSNECDPERGCVPAGRYGTPCADDGNPCTIDQCGFETCEHPPAFGRPCDDDGIECTIDACGETGCEHTANEGGECAADDDACTLDFCSAASVCTHEPFDADRSPFAAMFCQLENVRGILAQSLCTGACADRLRTKLGKISSSITAALNDRSLCEKSLRSAAKQASAFARTAARLTSQRKLRPAAAGKKLATALRAEAKSLRDGAHRFCSADGSEPF